MLNRAHSILELKSVDEDKREIRGVATTPTPDRMGDIVEPLGLSFAAELPLLHQHDSRRPVGRVKFQKATKDGVEFEATLAKVDEPQALKDRIDLAWGEVKSGLIRGVSIGFRELDSELIDKKDPWGGIRFTKAEVLELSLVTVPANQDATITQIRSIDRAASGRSVVRLPNLPRAMGTPKPQRKEGSAMKTLADQIAAFEATRAAKSARQNDIMQKAIDEGRTSDQAEQEEFDTLQDEVKAIDEDLVRLKALETNMKASAKPASVPSRVDPTAIVERLAPVTLKKELPKGTAFTRYVMAIARSHGNLMQAAEISKQWRDSTPEVETVLKAAVTAGTTTDSDWAQPLVEYQTMANQLIDLIRPATIIGRIPGLNRVPFNVRIPRVIQDSLVNWVGEGLPKPVGEMKFDAITLGVNKVAGIVVLTEELVRLSTPSAEATVRSNLVKVITKFLDQQFIDPAVAASAGIRPGSILNGVAGIPSSGTSVQDAREDIQALFGAFITTGLDVSSAAFITTQTIAMQLASLQNPLGQPEFTGMNATATTGGSLFGIPVVASQAVPAGVLALIDANNIMLADDGGVTIDISREATLQMDSAPVAANPATFSLFQNNCVGIRAERWITWRRATDAAVAYITGANYTGAVAVAGP